MRPKRKIARKRIRCCEVIVSLKEGRAVAVQRVLARYMHFDAHGLLDLDRQLEEARLRMDVSSADITAEDLSPEEQLFREAKTWLDRQVIAQECECEPDHDLQHPEQRRARDIPVENDRNFGVHRCLSCIHAGTAIRIRLLNARKLSHKSTLRSV